MEALNWGGRLETTVSILINHSQKKNVISLLVRKGNFKILNGAGVDNSLGRNYRRCRESLSK